MKEIIPVKRKREELELPAPGIPALFGAWTDSISRRRRQPRVTPREIVNPQNSNPHRLGRLASTFENRMKAILYALCLLPIALLGNSDLDYGGMYKNAGLIVEGHLSGEVIETIKIIKESKHPDIDFHEDIFIYTHLIIDGSSKFQNISYRPVVDVVEIDGKRTARYRVLIPERFYSEPYKAKAVNESNAWFLVSSPLGESLYAYEYLKLSWTKMFIPNYMEGAVGESLARNPNDSNKTIEEQPIQPPRD